MGCCNDKKHFHHDHHPHKFVDVSKIEPQPWEETPIILGMTECGNIVPVEKPENELTDEDREKLNTIITNGDGILFLSDDGKYKEVYTKEQSDDLFVVNGSNEAVNISSSEQMELSSQPGVQITGGYPNQKNTFLINGDGAFINGNEILTAGEVANTVMYDSNNDIRPRKNIIIGNDNNVSIIDGYARELPVIEIDSTINDGDYVLELGSQNAHLQFRSNNRPTVKLKGETGVTTREIAYLSEVEAGGAVVDELAERVEAVEQDVASLQNEQKALSGRVDALSDTVNDHTGRITNLEGEVSSINSTLENAVLYDSNRDIRAEANIHLLNDRKLLGYRTDGGEVNLIECSRRNIVDVGSGAIPLNLNSSTRPNVQLTGESGSNQHPIAFLSDVEYVQTQLDQHVEEYDAFKTTVNDAFNTVTSELGALDGRLDTAEQNIELNTGDIAQIRQDINDLEKFRGYFETTAEITSLPDPTAGDYAWNAQTGTVWSYNGTTWLDTEVPIPDQTVQPSTITPIRDQGTGAVGTSNTYARADHIHPEDTTKANVTDLENYLPLSGNSQTTPVTGDVWLSTGSKLLLSDSGNSYIDIEQPTAMLVVKGNGAGGVDLQSDLGTIKAKGQQIIVNGVNDLTAIQLSAPVVNLNASSGDNPIGVSLAAGGLTVSGQSANLLLSTGISAQVTNGDILLNPTTGKMYYGSRDDAGLNEVAKISNIESAKAAIEEEINDLRDEITEVAQDYVKKSGDEMTGSLSMTDGSDVFLDYNTTNPSAIIGRDGEDDYNLVVLGKYIPSSSVEIDQVTIGDLKAQFNAVSLYVPSVDMPTGTDITRLRDLYNVDLSATPYKFRFVVDSWLKDQFYNKTEVDGAISSIDLSPFLNRETGGNIAGTTTYKNNELATVADFNNYYDISTVNTLLGSKANVVDVYQKDQADLLFATKTDLNSSFDNLQEQIDNIDVDPKIAPTDQVITFEPIVGLKAHIGIVSDGNEITVTGKINEETGEPYEIATFNIVQNQIVERAFVQDNILHIVFIVDGGEQEVQVDLSQFITAYTGSQYIEVDESTNEISLNYNEVKETLLTDGFINDLSSVQDELTNVVKLTGAQTVAGVKTFTSVLNARASTFFGNRVGLDSGEMGASFNNSGLLNIYNESTGGLFFRNHNDITDVASIVKAPNSGMLITGNNVNVATDIFTYNNKEVATIEDIPTDYVDLTSEQAIGGSKTFTGNVTVDTGVLRAENMALFKGGATFGNRADGGQSAGSTLSSGILRLYQASGGIHFYNVQGFLQGTILADSRVTSESLRITAAGGLYLNDVEVATVDDIPTDYVDLTSSQEIEGSKNFSSSIRIGQTRDDGDGLPGMSLFNGGSIFLRGTSRYPLTPSLSFAMEGEPSSSVTITETESGKLDIVAANGLLWNDVQVATINDLPDTSNFVDTSSNQLNIGGVKRFMGQLQCGAQTGTGGSVWLTTQGKIQLRSSDGQNSSINFTNNNDVGSGSLNLRNDTGIFTIAGSSGIALTTASLNSDINITTGTGKAYYNDKELATLDDISAADFDDSHLATAAALQEHIDSEHLTSNDIPDMSEYATKERLNAYRDALREDIDTIYADKVDKIELVNYALKSDIPTMPDMSLYALKSDIPEITGYDFTIREYDHLNEMGDEGYIKLDADVLYSEINNDGGMTGIHFNGGEFGKTYKIIIRNVGSNDCTITVAGYDTNLVTSTPISLGAGQVRIYHVTALKNSYYLVNNETYK